MLDYKKMTREELIRELELVEGSKKSQDDLELLVQELKLHQIELEMQNRELKEVQQDLEFSRDLYTNLYDFAPVGYLTHDDRGIIKEINLTGAKLLGFERTELIGVPLNNCISTGDSKKILNHLLKCKRLDGEVKSEVKLGKKTQEEIFVEFFSIPLHNESGDLALYRTTITDITKRKLIERALKNHRKHLEAIFRSVKDGIITVDRKFKIIDVNESAKNICPIDDNFKGKSLKSLIKNFCGIEYFQELKKTIKEKNSAELYRIETIKHGSERQVITINITPLIGEKDEFLGAVMVVKDETRIVEMESKLRERSRFYNIIGKSEKMQKIFDLLEKLCHVSTTVLIKGESGTGKELVAEALHYKGERRSEALVKVNCSALSESLLESELFGHVKGAFTGAVKDKKGRFQKAHKGSIFLDEIADISPALQLSLLRILQEKEFEPVGDSNTIKVDFRIMVSTNQDLQQKVKLGKFREDLYYRLKVVELIMPPLRDKLEDLPLLVEHFIKKFNENFNKDIKGISKDVEKIFMEYSWPGNVRELEHSIEHAFILCPQNIITSKDLPEELKNFAGAKPFLSHKMDKEADLIRETLEKNNWKKTKAARLLGMDRKTLYHKIKKYNIIK